jgi:hypothetical protein
MERTRTVPTFTAVRSTDEVPGFAPTASPRLRRRPSPWPPGPDFQDPTRSSPHAIGSVETHREPAQIHRVSSRRDFKRRNNTGFSRIPFRLAHRARPIRQCWAVTALSRPLPPSPATPGSAASSFNLPLRRQIDEGLSPPSGQNRASWRTGSSRRPASWRLGCEGTSARWCGRGAPALVVCAGV